MLPVKFGKFLMDFTDHLSVGVPAIAAARRFYDPVMACLGAELLAETETFAAYGRERVAFVIILPEDGQAPTAGNGVHIAFSAHDEEQVQAFHATALEEGGKDDGAPGLRPEYPIPDVYAAFVIDPFGNKLEAIVNGFAA